MWPLRVALLTSDGGLYSSRRLIEAAHLRGLMTETLDIRCCDPDHLAVGAFDAVIPRIGSPIIDHGVAVVGRFEAMGACSLNSAAAIGLAQDKARTADRLACNGIPMPSTVLVRATDDQSVLIARMGPGPWVVKPRRGSRGLGVTLVHTPSDLAATLAAFQDKAQDAMVQGYVVEAKGADIRCLVIGDRVAASMKRQGGGGEFRSNLHLGGSALPVRISSQERDMAVAATRAIGLDVAGVDILRARHGPLVIEVNASPGLRGVEAVSGKDIASQVIRRLLKQVRARRAEGGFS